MFSVLLFILGALVGSFLNVCIYRLPRNMSVVHPPSHCPRCNMRLATRDLLPLVSQLALGGKCRYCGEKISYRYFGIEALTGILFVAAGWWAGPFGMDARTWNFYGDWPRLLQGLIFMGTLVVIFWVDLDTRLIPLEAAFLLGLAGVARDAWATVRPVVAPESARAAYWNSEYLAAGAESVARTGLTGGGFPGWDILPGPLPSSLWAMVVVSATLWAVREVFTWIYGREALGFGDVILVGAIAANLGWNATLWTFAFASVVLGASIGILVQTPRALRSRRWALQRARRYDEKSKYLPPRGEQVLAGPTDPADPVAPSSAQVLAAPAEAQQEPEAPEPSQVLAAPEADAIADASTSASNGAAEREASEREASEREASGRKAQWAQERAAYWRQVAPLLSRHALRKAMPFGPMLAIGAIVALLFGAPLNDAYMNAVGGPQAFVPAPPQ
jgi:leader peptidase (prepilin peptidase)/N-methyltransferase